VQPITYKRDWLWRGWQTRYVFRRSPNQTLPPILLLHGFGASVGHWRHNYAGLGRNHTIYALDLVGFGGSEKPATTYGTGVWVDQVFDFWRTFIGKPMIIIGNSLGSLVGLMAAHKHPQICKGLVTINLPDLSELEAMVPPPIRPLKRSLEALVGSLLAKPLFYVIRRPQIIKYVLANLAYSDRTNVDQELVEIIARPAREYHAATAFYYLNLSMNQGDDLPSPKEAIAQLHVPMLILWGSNDRLIPPSLGRKLVKCSPLAQLVELPNVGHCPQDEAPTLVNQQILQWITVNF